ncbi:MAG: metalloregulator ArsR/SmtB family transcription factor [Raineya sp.]|jgi:ArsR family transcriptional regulator|nr:metalloregulator ArsR/SmtB family transcription factor [Raineya sp.]
MAKKNTDKNKKLVAFFKAIAHPTRMSIVQLLIEQEQLTVNTICEKLDLEQSLTSHHLAGMRKSGLLSSKRNGKNIYYMLSSPKIKDILNNIKELL